MKKIGIITFHNSYNCGSMLQAYALQQVTDYLTGTRSEITDFSNRGQKQLYSVRHRDGNTVSSNGLVQRKTANYVKNSYLVQKKNKILTTMLRSFFHMLLEIKK